MNLNNGKECEKELRGCDQGTGEGEEVHHSGGRLTSNPQYDGSFLIGVRRSTSDPELRVLNLNKKLEPKSTFFLIFLHHID